MIRQSERKSQVYCNLGSAYLAVACNPGAIVVLHTPKSCSHLALNSFWNIRRRAFLRDPELSLPEYNNLFVTGISDKEAIFGGEKVLRKCLLDIIKLPNVQYIVVVADCTAGVIGDDVESVGKEIENISGIPVITVPGAGFMSKHYVDNNIRMLEYLLERFAPVREKRVNRPKTAMILGENTGTGNENNIKEIKRLLKNFGFEKILFPPNVMTKQEFEMIADVELIIPVGISREYFNKLQGYAHNLAVRYNAYCYPYNYPIGIEGTYEWLSGLGKLLQQNDLGKNVAAQERTAVENILEEMKKELQCKKYILVIGFPRRFFDAENHLKTLQAAGLDLKAVIFHNDLTNKEKEEHKLRLREFTEVPFYEEDSISYWQNNVDFVLTTTDLINVPHQLCLSIHQVGIWGVKNLLQKTIAAIQGSGRRIIYEY